MKSALIFVGFFHAFASLFASPIYVSSKQAITLTHRTLVVDGHNDLPWELFLAKKSDLKIDLNQTNPMEFHTDLTRLKQGGVGLQYWSAYVPAELAESSNALDQTLEQIDLIHRMVEMYPDKLEIAYTAADARRIFGQGKIASMIGVEGGYSIQHSLGVLRIFHRLGVRYLTLTHSKSTDWADSATDEPKHHGLSPFGREVVAEMNRLGILVDLSHVSDEVMAEVLKIAKAPVMFSHSSARAIANHPRNVPDDILKRVAINGGVVMVNFFSAFVEPKSVDYYRRIDTEEARLTALGLAKDDIEDKIKEWRTKNPMERGTLDTVLDHIDHIVIVAGIDHVGLGSDFDGVPVLPVGLEDVSKYPNLTNGLLERGYSEADISKILGENALRVLAEAELVATDLKKAVPKQAH